MTTKVAFLTYDQVARHAGKWTEADIKKYLAEKGFDLNRPVVKDHDVLNKRFTFVQELSP